MTHFISRTSIATMLMMVIALQTVAQTDTSTTETMQADQTSRIQNPSFETNGLTGWTVNNMNTQGNSVFSIKHGSYYVETWVSIGQKIADASVKQTLKKLPQGNYTLTAKALHIQQTGSESTTNQGLAQTGAYLFAGLAKTPINDMKQYSVSFSVLDATQNVEIGLIAENATGNYLCIDNFTLQYTGGISIADHVQELQNMILQGDILLDKGIQTSAATALNTAIEAGKLALLGTGTDESGNTLYDQEALTAAR
ncbi:MAG: hypothetical protein IKK67_09885, partial [Bacteroidaceae bacterium]|nr:hypothetical protein [Bacteroidaceae bacterium]